MGDFKLSETSLSRREGVDPRLIKIDDLAISISLIDFGHPKHAGRRTKEQQYQLFEDGKSKCDGQLKLSRHQFGLALDFYAYVDGAASWEPGHLTLVACAYLQAASVLGYQLQWGGLWTGFRDMPHVELLEVE